MPESRDSLPCPRRRVAGPVISRGVADGSWLSAGGLVGLLVLIAAIVLLFTARCPRSLYALVMGMDRWSLRVAG